MRYIRDLIQRIPPYVVIYALYFLSAWLVFSSLGQLWAIWPEVFSGEEVTNIW